MMILIAGPYLMTDPPCIGREDHGYVKPRENVISAGLHGICRATTATVLIMIENANIDMLIGFELGAV